jgi:DNA invertase Pin-like site-specific DNA recombinase
MRICIYTRVSLSEDKGQDPQNQFTQLRDFVQKQPGWKITHYYNDHATGKNGDRDGSEK